MCCSRSFLCALALTALLFPAWADTGFAGQQNPIRVINPAPGAEIIARQPDIQALFTEEIDSESLIILLDDNDITAMVEFTDNGFHGRIPMQLTGGSHSLYIAGNSPDGPFEQEITFTSKQTGLFDEATTSNEWSINLRTGNFHSNKSDDFIATNLDSTLQHESTLKKGNWQVSLSAGARLLEDNYYNAADEHQRLFTGGQQNAYGPQEQTDQAIARNQGSIDPERQGLDLNTLLMRAQYENETVTTALEMGDLQIMESKNTFANLARNGGRISVDLHSLYLGGFSVFGKDTFGVHDGIGIGFDNSDHLYGVTGGVRLFGEKVDLRGFYMDGGQEENSYSTWSQEQGNQGNVFGFVLRTGLLQDLLVTEFEYDHSDFDPNTGDEFAGEQSEAYRFEVSGQKDIYGYDVTYEYFGPEYNVPGNLTPKRDYVGVVANGSVMLDTHSVNLVAGVYHDNVDDNPLYARTNSIMGQFDYSYLGFLEFPINLSLQYTTDQSTDEPMDARETNLTTETVSLSSGYTPEGPVSVNVMASYSWQNDDSAQDADLATWSFTVSPTLTLDTVFISLSGTINENRDLLSGTRTNDYVLTLDTMGSLFNERLSYALGGTYDQSLITDNSGDRRGFTGYSRVAWMFDDFAGLSSPSLGVEVQYNSDTPQDVSTTEDIRVYCTLSASIPFNY